MTTNRRQITRRSATASLAGLAALSLGRPALAQKRELLIAEPQHQLGYLPLYVAIRNGYMAEEGLDVRALTTGSGSVPTNTVLTGQAFAHMGGPEHNAFAKAKGADMVGVVHCVDRGNIYICARKGMEPKDQDFAAFFKGKRIACSPYGGTPNSIVRYYLSKWKLNPRTDVAMIEIEPPAVPAAVRSGQADIGAAAEPHLTRGIAQGIWGEPMINALHDLGPYAYSTINVRGETAAKEPKLVEAFVRGMMRGLKLTNEDPEQATALAHKEFPTMAPEDMKATLDRSYADSMWSRDGIVTPQAWDTAKAVVMEASILKQDIAYDAIFDMRFVKAVEGSL